MKISKRFDLNQRVEFARTSSLMLDGIRGTIVGIAAAHAEGSHLIVLLDEPLCSTDRYGHRAIQITEWCLDAV